MTMRHRRWLVAAFAFAMTVSAAGQSSQSATGEPSLTVRPSEMPTADTAQKSEPLQNPDSPPQGDAPAPQPLFNFKDSDIKFDLRSFTDSLRDRKHEGWVLAAYPDPQTSRPLIGAGFSLDVQATEHPQSDPLNPHPFLEPSSAQLWQAAGLDPARLQRILDQYNRQLATWTKKKYRRKIRKHALAPQISEEEATQLLRISAIQAIENAKAYCRDFDRLTAPQQMAVSHLVFQMGVNLEEFVQFRSAMNGDLNPAEVPESGAVEPDVEHWKTVQRTLIESEWARRYSGRAATVIAMFDPEYDQSPATAEQRVAAILRPVAIHRRHVRTAGAFRVASYRSGTHRTLHKKTTRLHRKRKLT
jgi:hypothetical protein